MKKHAFILILFARFVIAGDFFLPGDPADQREPVGFSQMLSILENLSASVGIRIDTAGYSVEGRPLVVASVGSNADNPLRYLFYAQQHGDEPAGKDGLLYFITAIGDGSITLPENVQLTIMPCVNPDGAVANKRRNANGYDLNRDHMLLSQPETRALHRLCRKVKPHIMVDCHEFGRMSEEYTDRKWIEWPEITMDYANNPMLSPAVVELGDRFVGAAEKHMTALGYHFCRYYVGSAPPEGELRFSNPECDDGRNGLATYGGLSFIVESGMLKQKDNPHGDLGKRVSAYLALFKWFIGYGPLMENADRTLKRLSLSPFIPVNYFWANKGERITPVRVIDRTTSRTRVVETANFMHDLVIKKSVATPFGYVVLDSTSRYRDLLERQNIPYVQLKAPVRFVVRTCRLDTVFHSWDPVYSRYSGRQIVKRLDPAKKTFPAGSLLVLLDSKMAHRAVLLLEPARLYGLYQHDIFRSTVSKDNIIPVYPVVDDLSLKDLE